METNPNPDPIATIDEIRAAMKAQWKVILPQLLAFAISICKNPETAAELIGAVVEALLAGDRHWNKVKKPELKFCLFNAIGSEWANTCAAEARARKQGWRVAVPRAKKHVRKLKASVENAPDSERNAELRKVKEEDDDELRRILAHARQTLAKDEDGLTLLDVIEGNADIPPEMLSDTKRFDLTRRRVKYAVDKATEEVGAS